MCVGVCGGTEFILLTAYMLDNYVNLIRFSEVYLLILDVLRFTNLE